MRKQMVALLAGALLMMATSAMATTIVNGGFESGDFSGWSAFGPGSNAVVVTSATAFDGTVYNATEGNYFARFDATSGAIQNQISWNAGDWISFKWAFLAEDYMPYNDYSLFTLTQNAVQGQLANVKLSDVASVGDFGDTGWNMYGYQFQSAGTGWVMFNSVNTFDNANSSILLVDDVSNTPVPEPGTMMLLGMGLLGMAVYGKRRMNKNA